MRRGVNVRDKLDVAAQGIVRQLLQLGRSHRVRLDNRRSAPELKVSLQLNGKPVDLEKSRLPQRRFENVQVLQMMRIVPIDDPQPQIGPILNLSLREPETAIPPREQLEEALHAVK